MAPKPIHTTCLAVCLLALPVMMHGQGPTPAFHLRHGDTADGQTCVEVVATGFELAAFQWSIHWPANQLSYSHFQDPGVLNGLLAGTHHIGAGRLSAVWNHLQPGNVTLPDSTVLCRLCFEASSLPCGAPTTLAFGDQPTPRHAYRTQGGNLVEVSPTYEGVGISRPLPTVSVMAGRDTLCLGDTVQLTATGHADYFDWTAGAATLSHPDRAVTLAFPSTPTTYTVAAGTPCGEATASLHLHVRTPEGRADMSDTIIFLGDPVRLAATGGVAYAWQPNPWPVDDPTAQYPTAWPAANTLYTVRITDIHGCAALANIAVAVRQDTGLVANAPDVITPNGDGYNDQLVFEGLEQYGANTLKVFNRWGSLVFSAIGYDNHWDGRHNGALLPPGVYYYVLEVQGLPPIRSPLTIIYEP